MTVVDSGARRSNLRFSAFTIRLLTMTEHAPGVAVPSLRIAVLEPFVTGLAITASNPVRFAFVLARLPSQTAFPQDTASGSRIEAAPAGAESGARWPCSIRSEPAARGLQFVPFSPCRSAAG